MSKPETQKLEQPAAIDWTSVDWEHVEHELLMFAHGLAHRRRREGVDPIIANGVSIGDLVSQVITDCLEGQRVRYDPAKGPLLPFLKRALQGNYLDLFRTTEAQTPTISVEQVHRDPADQLPPASNPKRRSKRPRLDSDGELDPADAPQRKKEQARQAQESQLVDLSPEEQLLRKENLAELRRLATGDPELEDVIAAITEHDLRKPKDLAWHLRTTPKNINNRFKRLRRRLEEFRTSQGAQRGRQRNQ